jgi:PKD repeat protein
MINMPLATLPPTPLPGAQNPVLSYPLSGSYTLTLTAKNGDSAARTVTQNVKVLDRFMKQVQITGFNPSVWGKTG